MTRCHNPEQIYQAQRAGVSTPTGRERMLNVFGTRAANGRLRWVVLEGAAKGRGPRRDT